MSHGQNTKNNIAWEKLFDKYQILADIERNGRAVVTSSAIKEFREPRLMTKFDHSSNLPSLFRKHKLTILPITRGKYVIAKMRTYRSLDHADDHGVIYLEFPPHIQSIEYTNITSEAAAINCAYVSGIFADFLDEEELQPTVSGRMSSGSFDFAICRTDNSGYLQIDVNNSQIEIDAGYEGVNSLSLIEAKMSISSDFLVRQLYYPFRLWREKVSKEIKLLFLVYSNGVFHLYQYCFEDPNIYNSVELVKYQRYSLGQADITLDDIQKLLNSADSVAEPEIPFPQADSFERVINLCELLFDVAELSQEEVTTTYDFDVRQTRYYIRAGSYLGFIERIYDGGVKYRLTDKGRALFEMSYREKQLCFAHAILRHNVFSKTLALYLKKSEAPSRAETIAIMKDSGLYKVKSDETYKRRASTVLGWTHWILSLLD